MKRTTSRVYCTRSYNQTIAADLSSCLAQDAHEKHVHRQSHLSPGARQHSCGCSLLLR